MPVIVVQCPELTPAIWKEVVRDLTDAAARLSGARPDKVQLFHEDEDVRPFVSVRAIGEPIDEDRWKSEIIEASRTLARVFRLKVRANVRLFRPENTAKGGEVRGAPAV